MSCGWKRIALAAIGMGAAWAGEASAQAVGKVDKVEAEVTATSKAGTRRLEPATNILYEDVLVSGPKARLQATLQDGTQLTLGENGRLVVDRFVYDPAKAGGGLDLRVTRGAFLFVGGKVEEKSGGAVSIRTPVATLGVRGTTVWGGRIDGGYGVLVLSGEVDVRTARGTVKLRKGQGTLIRGTPSSPAPWSADRTRRAVATIAFTP
ncbi:FecR family protein [Prosthecomicrobium sp. N25]|uniref:FecR family protein n=1 Tax=Prosthecomicrobium sp. N25 TaxID=3129254 RepID=UPI0030774348